MGSKDCKRENGNCTAAVDDKDGLAVQCVGAWASDKHYYIKRYIEASRQARSKWAESAFVDLFAGPARARVRETKQFIDGSPLIALQHAEAPFTKVVLCDLDDENVDVLGKRTAKYGDRVEIIHGDCNKKIDAVLRHVPRGGLNVTVQGPGKPDHVDHLRVRDRRGIEDVIYLGRWSQSVA